MASTLTKKQLKKLRDMVSSLPTNVQIKQSRKGRSRRKAKKENQILAKVNDVENYIHSLQQDVLQPRGILPSPNYFGPVRKHFVQGRVQLNLANTANLHGGLTVNPNLLFFRDFYFQKDVGGVDATVTIPTCFQHATTSTSGGLPSNNSPAGTGLSTVELGGRISNLAAGARTGWARCLGVHFKIVYTGTWNNRGGSIVLFTNPSQVSLACQYEVGGVIQQPLSPFVTVAEIDQAMEVTQVHALSDEFSWTWRPSDLQFKHFEGYIPMETALVAASNSGNPQVFPYLSSEGNPAAITELGWTTGFEIRPAAGTQGALSNYYVDITAEYDLHETISSDTSAGLSSLMTMEHTKAEPMAIARVQNALSATHIARRQVSLVPAAKSLALNTLKMGASLAKNAAVEAMASRMAAAFA